MLKVVVCCANEQKHNSTFAFSLSDLHYNIVQETTLVSIHKSKMYHVFDIVEDLNDCNHLCILIYTLA